MRRRDMLAAPVALSAAAAAPASPAAGIYQRLGVRTFINAVGTITTSLVGG